MPGRPILKDIVSTKLLKLLKLDNLTYVICAEVAYLSNNDSSPSAKWSILLPNLDHFGDKALLASICTYAGLEFGLKSPFWHWQGARPLEAPETGTLQPPRALLRPFGGFVQPPGQKNWNFFLKKSNVPKTPQYSKKPRQYSKKTPKFWKNRMFQKNPCERATDSYRYRSLFTINHIYH